MSGLSAKCWVGRFSAVEALMSVRVEIQSVGKGVARLDLALRRALKKVRECRGRLLDPEHLDMRLQSRWKGDKR